MCDTLVVLPDSTERGEVLLAKNSDREPNEAQQVVLVAAADHPADAVVPCTYLAIPQVARTHAVLLSQPYWMWGAEMGANEHGVVIGNEAVFTRVPHTKEPALLGMDLLRLALERATTAAEAVDVICRLLKAHGQGGQAGHTKHLEYDNSFLVADPREAWVLETAGREWAAQRVTAGVRSISNALSLHGSFDRSSDGLISYAVGRGWCRGAEDFDFAGQYSDRIYTRFGRGFERQCRTGELAGAVPGGAGVLDAMTVLRDHGPGGGPHWTPATGLTGVQVCMHAGFGPIRGSQSVASLVSRLPGEGLATHWVTGASAPCTALFAPVWFDSGLPDQGPAPTGRRDEGSRWWRHERLHRATLADYPRAIAMYADERDDLQRTLVEQAEHAAAGSLEDRAACSRDALAQIDAAEARWVEAVVQATAASGPRSLHAKAWRSWDRQAFGAS